MFTQTPKESAIKQVGELYKLINDSIWDRIATSLKFNQDLDHGNVVNYRKMYPEVQRHLELLKNQMGKLHLTVASIGIFNQIQKDIRSIEEIKNSFPDTRKNLLDNLQLLEADLKRLP